MIKGYADAYKAFGDEEFLQTAITHAEFIHKVMWDGTTLKRNYKDGYASINAFLDDYALLIETDLTLFEMTGEMKWLEHAEALHGVVEEAFYDDVSGMYFYTSANDPALIARKKELYDNVIPGSNSVMANNLFRLGHLTGNHEFIDRAVLMLQHIWPGMSNYGTGHSNWGLLLLNQVYPYHEVVIVGKDARIIVRELDNYYVPNKLVVYSEVENKRLPLTLHRETEGETRIYVCQNNACKLPVDQVAEAIELMK